jgi:hypothetical protein
LAKKQWRTWRTSEKIIVAVVAAPFVFLIWSAVRSTLYDADMEERVRASFQPIACDVKSVSYTELRGRTSTGATSSAVSGYDVHVEYAYSVDGQAYVSKRIAPRYRSMHTLSEAQTFVTRYQRVPANTCYYDPSNPSVAFLQK